MSLIDYPIRCIGTLALAELHLAQSASLLGVTSRGMFLLTNRQGVIFLSLETQRGPWTANLLGLPPGWQAAPLGKTAQIQSGRIILPTVKAYFDCAAAQTWQPLAPDPAAVDLAGMPARYAAVNRLLAAGGERGFSPLLPEGEAASVLPEDERLPPTIRQDVPQTLRPVRDAISRLCAALRDGDPAQALQAGEDLLGFGSGLTPSGDDLLCGLLLGLSRWGAALGRSAPPEFSPALLTSARQRTTSLSAALLQAAALGLADERLLLAADGLLTGALPPQDIAAALLAYGNSSGLDFWIGLAQVMTLII